MFQKLRRNYRTARWIRAAIDTYPDGICFASSDGRPILANQKINAVCHALTGHTITNANAMWNELKQMQTEECLLDFDIVSAEMTGQNRKEQIIHRLSDGSIWQFQKQSLAATDPATGRQRYCSTKLRILHSFTNIAAGFWITTSALPGCMSGKGNFSKTLYRITWIKKF